MENINVVISHESGIAKDPHPLGPAPVKPVASDFKDAVKLKNAQIAFDTAMQNWLDADDKLNTYQNESMVCDSGIVVSNKVLHWHVGKKYKAIKLENQSIQII